MKPHSSDIFSPAGELSPTHEKIAGRATELWKSYGSPIDRDKEIWLEAERLLLGEAKKGPFAESTTAASAPGQAPANETEIGVSPKSSPKSRPPKRRSS